MSDEALRELVDWLRSHATDTRAWMATPMTPFHEDVYAATMARADALESALSELARLRAERARDKRQERIAEWCAAAFGSDHASNIEQRGLRLAEESIEAAQAAGCDPATLHKLIDYIYAKPRGELRQELGGVQLCALAMANAAGFSADEAEGAEIERVLAKPLEFFAARNRVKNEAGFVVGWQSPVQSHEEKQG